MKLEFLNPTQKLKASIQKQNLKREQIEIFKSNIKSTFTNIMESEKRKESEEHLKVILRDFLLDTYYKGKNAINTKERKDLVIHNGSELTSTAGVLIETKQPSNKSEMISAKNPNSKSFQQLITYYLHERFINENKEIKHLIITNIYEWYIFDASDFERYFFENKKLRDSYKSWNDGNIGFNKTDWFYKEVVNPHLEQNLESISCTYFNLKDYEQVIFNNNLEDDEALLDLYKILSPEHLLKKQTTNDSNSLNDKFYQELLHIVGIEEVKEGGSKKTIKRCKIPNDGSLLENTLNKLKKDFREISDTEEQYSIALELCITWLNRILFLKLLEGQLIKYNHSLDYAFLSYDKIKDYDELEELFFEVLAENYPDRSKSVNEQFGNIPYLNSSLFEKTELEKKYFGINVLKDRLDLPIYDKTVLNFQVKGSSKRTLEYLFEFLNAYDFGDVSKGKIKEESKTIINASVLGLIFEKINGYKDGSFYTPSFITMYMCRESIRRAVIQKFNESFHWKCNDFKDLYNKLDKISIQEANSTINNLHICDPAVGSGHFLVSALNEIIAIKSDLEILADKDFKRIKGYKLEIENDELIIKDEEGKLYEYNPKNAESRRIQETLFHEKQTIIENCLFGVDINPKSVMICRLRLWIELLKNAYYTESSKYKELETLPNIDINIKCGNSLVSRFDIYDSYNALPSQTRTKIKQATEKYKYEVAIYKATDDKATKKQTEKNITDLKSTFCSITNPSDRDYKKWKLKEAELLNKQAEIPFGDEASRKLWNIEINKLAEESQALNEYYHTKLKTLYADAFEWRFEFPEVLNEDGDFTGFDVVIGNPPYIQLQRNNGELAKQLSEFNYQTFEKTGDIYSLFYELGFRILKPNGYHCYITSSQWTKASYGYSLRKYFLSKNPEKLILLGAGMFDSAVVDTNILIATNTEFQNQLEGCCITHAESIEDLDKMEFKPMSSVNAEDWSINDNLTNSILEKIKAKSKPLNEWKINIYRGILTGFNEAFIIDQAKRDELVKLDKKNEEVIRPILRGREIEKYITDWDGSYLINTHNGVKEKKFMGTVIQKKIPRIEVDNYPKIIEYLDSFGHSLVKRQDKGDTNYNLRNCAYIEEFKKEKIVWKRIGSQLRFSYSENEIYCLDSTCIATGEKIKYLTGLLNSKLCHFQLFHSAPKTGMGDLIISVQALEPLLVHYPDDKFESQIVKLVDKIIAQKQKDPKADTSELENEIDRMVYAVYGLSEEEIEIINNPN